MFLHKNMLGYSLESACRDNSNEYPKICFYGELMKIEPSHDKTSNMACTPSEDSDQPGHPPRLISLCCPYEESLGP